MVRVKKRDEQISIEDPEHELIPDQYMRMTTVRMLEPCEKVISDFSVSKTLSAIVEQFPGRTDKSLNSLRIESVINAAQYFSSPTHSVRADDRFLGNAVAHKWTVDIDSVSATFKHRGDIKKNTIDNVFTFLQDIVAQKDSTFCENTTSFMPNCNALKAFPSNGFIDKHTNRRVKCCGPTIEIYPDGGFSRIQLPTPIGAEVLKIWIYAPDSSFKTIKFVDEVRTVANQCAKGLVARYKSSIESTLNSAIDGNLKGFKAFDIPGGFMFPISIALLLLEKHQTCSFVVETFNCKKKGLVFQMEPQEFGTDSWIQSLTGKMKGFISTHSNTMLKMFCRLDRMAQAQPDLSKIGFGFQIQYKDVSGNTLYSICKPNPADCNRVTGYPMAFLPSELVSSLSYLKSGVRIQSYIPLWHEANFKRNKKDRKHQSNLGLKHCMEKNHEGGLLLNVTQVLRGAKEEQKIIDNICGRFPNDFCERVEIAVPWKFGCVQSDGPLCFTNQTKQSETRWLDLKTMLSNSFHYIKNDTRFWNIGPIADYITLNFAAALAVYQTSARGMADTTLLPLERDQLCQNMVYLNYLLRIAKDGKLWQKKHEEKLSILTRGAKYGREMMLPPVPGRVYSLLAAYGGISLPQSPTVSPVAANQVETIETPSTPIIDKRILDNTTASNDFRKRVLRCRTCDLGFYGGKGINDTELFVTHFEQYPAHASVTSARTMTNQQWCSDYQALLTTVKQRYDSMYNEAQKRGYDVIITQQKNALLLGIAGAGKSLLVQDLLPLLRCLFWKKDEVQVCGATNVCALRADDLGSTFHSFLGIRCEEDGNGGKKWDFSVEECLQKIQMKKGFLKNVRVVIIEEGLEVPSALMEAYFHFINVNRLNIITIVNGDCCQGAYREDDQTGQVETSFFAQPIKLAQLCPTLEMITFTKDQRTKNAELKAFKMVVRNAQASDAETKFVATNQYQVQTTKVDIVLCSRIKDMNKHNAAGLGRNVNTSMNFLAVESKSCNTNYHLNYKIHGVSHSITLRQSAPVMFMQHYKSACGKVLRNGTLGTVTQLTDDSVHVEVTSNKGLKQTFIIKRVQIGKTQWQQLPLHLAYAGTIAKCIGFEFESIAIDFGIKDDADCTASWRQKQAYTAISRAKQRCYFVGEAPVKLLNNMDMRALSFFNRLTQSNQKQARTMDVVRNVFEMREFWVRRMASRKRINSGEICQADNSKMSRTGPFKLSNPIQGTTVADNIAITVYANKYPNTEQNIDGQGHIVAAISQDDKLLLLKRYCEISADIKRTTEICVLTTCRDLSCVLKLVATVEKGIVLEWMENKVSWNHFVKHSTLEAKRNLSSNLSQILIKLRENNIAHRNISKKTAWVDLKGNMKLTWFQEAEYPSTKESANKDKTDVNALCESLALISKSGDDSMNASDSNSESTYSDIVLEIDDCDHDIDSDGEQVTPVSCVSTGSIYCYNDF